MTSRDNCIEQFRGKIPKEMFDDIVDSDNVAEHISAGIETLQLEKRQKALQIIAIRNSSNQMDSHSRGLDWGLMSVLGRDIFGEGVGDSVESRSAAILGDVHADVSDVLHAYNSGPLGLSKTP
ncbi:hypothetical protein, partial [Solemya elarraichensis gill symbiont]